MSHPASAKHKNSATMPYRKIKITNDIRDSLHLPGGQRIITHSWDGSFRIWDMETGTQVKEWEENFSSIALSPDGKTLASGSWDGAVKLWSIDTGKVIKTLTEHTEKDIVCWSPDGGRVVGRSLDGTFRVWDVKSEETIVGPVKAGRYVYVIRYSPDAKMIATAVDDRLKIWDGNTGELLKTLDGFSTCLAWTSNGKILTTWALFTRGFQIMKFDTATWTVLDARKNLIDSFVRHISLSPDERFAITSFSRTVQLWHIETDQPIETLHHEDIVNTATFSADGKFLFTRC
ncbi:WD40 repeat-like protein [Suillus hirtellus]|nr:WD40 repeat-like protein [Suillus hirtellus]